MLGYHGLKEQEENYLKDIFLVLRMHQIDIQVLDMAILLRKTYKIKLGDSIKLQQHSSTVLNFTLETRLIFQKYRV